MPGLNSSSKFLHVPPSLMYGHAGPTHVLYADVAPCWAAGDVARTVLERILIFEDHSGAFHEFEDHHVTGRRVQGREV